MLSACMRATFKDVSTLGIVMGDTNIGCGEVAKVLERNIGAIQDCDYHPKTPNFNDRLDLVTGDYVFAGEATTTNIPCDKLVGLDGDHVAILARVTFRGPRCVELADDASTLAPAVTGNPDTQPQDVARAEALLGRLHGQAVPHEQEPSDSAMAAPSVEHQHETMLPGRTDRQDLQEGGDEAADAEEVRRLWQQHDGAAMRLRERIWQDADSSDVPSSVHQRQAQEVEMLRESHRIASGEIRAQQAKAADIQARHAVAQQRAEALAEVADAARRQPDQGIEARGGGGAEAQQQAGAGAGAEEDQRQEENREDRASTPEAKEQDRREAEEKAAEDEQRQEAHETSKINRSLAERIEEQARQPQETPKNNPGRLAERIQAEFRRRQEPGSSGGRAAAEAAEQAPPRQPPGLAPSQEAAKKEEEARQQEDAQRQEEEAAKEEEARRQEAPPEEARRQGEEAAQEEEARRQEEQAAKEEEESRPQEEEAAMEEEARRKEEAASAAARQARQQELEDDKERAKFLRRPGLLIRVLVDHDGSRFGARPGGVNAAIAHVASVLHFRRVTFSEARERAHATTPAPGWEEFLPILGGNVLARHLQAEVEEKVNHAWRKTDDGKLFVRKAMDIAKEAAENQKSAAKGGKGRKKGRGAASASTPGAAEAGQGPDDISARFEREMKKYFRTHCDQAYGDLFWLKLLITFDDIPEYAVNSYNDLCIVRAMEKRQEQPGELADYTPDRAYLRRADRASTPVQDGYVRPGVLRWRAKERLDTLRSMQDEGEWVDPNDLETAKKMMADAEEISVRSFHAFTSYWTGERKNARPSTEASMFEMVLQKTLAHHGFDSFQIATIMDDRTKWNRKGKDKGGASTPAQGQNTRAAARGGRGGMDRWRGRGGQGSQGRQG